MLYGYSTKLASCEDMQSLKSMIIEKILTTASAIIKNNKEELNVDTKNLELLSVNSTPLEAKGTKHLAFQNNI